MFDADATRTRTDAALDARRIRLRGQTRNAAEAFAPNWPLETFIACNPLLGLEGRPFEAAVAAGEALFGGRGFLPLSTTPGRIASGAIDAATLDAAFAARFGGRDGALTLGGETLTEAALLRAHLTAGVDLPLEEAGADAAAADPAREIAARLLVKWCAAYFDAGIAAWPLPGRERGLFACWRALAPHDDELGDLLGDGVYAALPETPEVVEDVIAAALAARGVPSGETGSAIRAALALAPGWTGFVKWAEANPSDWSGPPADLADLAALALWLDALATRFLPISPSAAAGAAAIAGPLAPAQTLAAAGLSAEACAAATEAELRAAGAVLAEATPALGMVALEAAEETFRTRLLGALAASPPAPASAVDRPAAQAVFCIDVRSEPFRRRLEAEGAFETAGYAGFFGIPLRFTPFDGAASRSLCPVLLAPSHHVVEAARPAAFDEAREAARAVDRRRSVADAFDGAKRDLAAPFGLAEAVGVFSGIGLMARTMAPRFARSALARLKATVARRDAFAPELSGAGCGHGGAGLTLEAKTFYARAMFAMTGLKPAGRLLAILGHGGETVNNAYASALDCGACGGAAGGPSAKVMAAILNDPDVREKLAEAGVAIPEDCVAIAGQHNTTTDEVTLYARDALPPSHQADAAAFEAALAAAGAATRAARAPALGDRGEALCARAGDWAQVRPEWGLAGCGAFIVGPRALTAGADLKGRCFLHSYDWETDGDGASLTTILTAPMVVAEWIACQYYFSTVDPQVYGAGDKVTQNVVGGVGVMQGNESDLMRGLPLQSTHDDLGRPYHEPIRLMTVVQAPVERVEAVIAGNPVLQTLFGNGWVALHVLDPATGESLRRDASGGWRPIAPPAGLPATLPATGQIEGAAR